MEEANSFIAPKMAAFNTKAVDVAEEWTNWSRQFEIYLLASKMEAEPDKRKVALLLHLMGPDSLQIFNSFDMDINVVKYVDLVAKFKTHFIPKLNISMVRHAFFCRRQGEETITEYATALENLSLSCNFTTLRESLVRDIFICGLAENYRNIKERLLSDEDITWTKALEVAKSIEIAKQNLSNMRQDVNPVVAALKY